MSHVSLVPTTELDVVNKMLRAIKEAAVSELTEPTTTDVSTALQILSDTNRQFQEHGWHFNRDFNVTIARNANNELVLGSNIMSIFSTTKDVTMRGLKLYDRVEKTFTFTQDLTDLTTITLLPFEDLPPIARTYLALACARIMQEEIFTDRIAESINVNQESQAWASLIDDEAERRGSNMATGTVDMINTVRRDRLPIWFL